jgi:hypothetical protein
MEFSFPLLKGPNMRFLTSGFFRQTTLFSPLIHRLKPCFKIWLWIRRENQLNWLHCGVSDSAEHVTVVSILPLCNVLLTLSNIFVADLKDSFYQEIWLGCTYRSTAMSLAQLEHAQQYHWHRSDISMTLMLLAKRCHHTAVTCTAVSMTSLYLRTSYLKGSGYLLRNIYWKNIHRKIALHFIYYLHTKIRRLTKDIFCTMVHWPLWLKLAIAKSIFFVNSKLYFKRL